MTNGRIPYRSARDCCDGPGDILTHRREQSVNNGETKIWVRCRYCGAYKVAESEYE